MTVTDQTHKMNSNGNPIKPTVIIHGKSQTSSELEAPYQK